MTTPAAASVLDDTTLAQMRAEAEAAAGGPFVDPALLRDAGQVLPWVPSGWLARVVGRAMPSWRHLDNADLFLAVRAATADAAYLAEFAAQARAESEQAARGRRECLAAEAQAIRDKWAALAARLPVPVAVWHNWTARHLDGYEQGADHIVVLADLHAGRLHRRARSPLCRTPSRFRQLRHVTPNAGDERRIPDCKACLRHAEHLAQAKEG